MNVFVVYSCPKHRTKTLCFEHNDGRGTRLLGGKCCVQQYEQTVALWTIDAHKAEEIIEMLSPYA